jgi:methyl-accepting chemotaxis protein
LELLLLDSYILCIVIAKKFSTPLEKVTAAMKKAKEWRFDGTINDNETIEISEVCHNLNEMITI